MSIILERVDMPSKNQSIVIEIKPNGRCSMMKIEKGECYELTTKGEAKAIQIPKGHGRLIDESKIFVTTYDDESDDGGYETDAPTILEAEE